MSAEPAAVASPWIEQSRNPFLVREWRRTARSRVNPLVVGWVLIGLSMVGLAAVIVLCLLLVWMQRLYGGNLGLGPSSVGNAARFAAVWVIGAAAWTVIGLGYWLAVGQTWIEEQQVNLELLLVTPLSRAGIVRALLAWPLAGTALCLLPLLPLLVLLMPFLGLTFGGALRVALAILAVAALPMVRAPSAAAVRAERRTQRSVLALGLYGLLALIAVPWLSSICVKQLGLTGFSLLRWPLALGEALAARPAFWGGTTWLGGWVAAVLATALCGRGLAAWQRLCEGSEARVAPPAAAAPWLWALAAWTVGGLWTGRHTLAALPDRLWFGLHLSLGVAFIVVSASHQRWLLWWIPSRWAARATVLLAILDAGLVALLAPGLWTLAQQRMGAPTAWPVGEATLDLALLLMMVAGWSALTEASGARRAARASALLLLLVPLGWLSWALSSGAPTGHGWTGRCFGFTPGLRLALGLLTLLPLLGSLARRVAVETRQAGHRTGEQSLTWRLMPAAWRANPLVLKGLRTASRRGIVRASGWTMAGLAVCGLLLGLVAAPRLAQGAVAGHTAGGVAALLSVGGLAALGHSLAQYWLGTTVGFPAAVLLGLSGLLSAGMVFMLPAMAAGMCGKVVTHERVHGALGFVLLSDLSDREVADGYLVGQLYPALELLVYFAVTLVIWALATFHWQILGLALLVILMAVGLLAAAAAAALLGTARYATRADGTVDSLVGVALFQAAGWGTLQLAAHVSGPGVPDAILAVVWTCVTLVVGVLAWRATPAAFRRLRRSCRLWQAFEAAGREAEPEGEL